MGKVSYGQAGYIGQSLSERAAAAYADGEAPRSKWTKSAMLAAIGQWCEDEGRVLVEDVSAMRRDEVFERFFERSSWHHTGAYARETDFYARDEDSLMAASREETPKEAGLRERARTETAEVERAERERRRAEERERRERAEAELVALGPLADLLRRRNPYGTPAQRLVATMAAREARDPGRYEVRVSKKGNVMIRDSRTDIEVDVDRALGYVGY